MSRGCRLACRGCRCGGTVADSGNEQVDYPALEDGERAKPVDGEVEQDEIGAEQLVQLGGDGRGEGAGGVGVALLNGGATARLDRRTVTTTWLLEGQFRLREDA